MRNKFNMFDLDVPLYLHGSEETYRDICHSPIMDLDRDERTRDIHFLNRLAVEVSSVMMDLDIDNERTMKAIKSYTEYTTELYYKLFELGLDVLSSGSYSTVAVCPWDCRKVIKVGINRKDRWLKWAELCSTVADKTMLPTIHHIYHDKDVNFYMALMDRYSLTFEQFCHYASPLTSGSGYVPSIQDIERISRQHVTLIEHLNKRGISPLPTEEFLLSDKGEDTAYHFIYQDNMPFLNDLRSANLMIDTDRMQLIITDPLS